MVFIRRGVDDINGVDTKFSVVMGSTLGSFNLLKLLGELFYLVLKSNNGIIPPHFMSLLK